MSLLVMLAAAIGGMSLLMAFSSGSTPASNDITEVMKQYEASIMDIPGVTIMGQGTCDGEPCIKIWVDAITPELEEQVPQQIGGYKVELEAGGPVLAQDS